MQEYAINTTCYSYNMNYKPWSGHLGEWNFIYFLFYFYQGYCIIIISKWYFQYTYFHFSLTIPVQTAFKLWVTYFWKHHYIMKVTTIKAMSTNLQWQQSLTILHLKAILPTKRIKNQQEKVWANIESLKGVHDIQELTTAWQSPVTREGTTSSFDPPLDVNINQNTSYKYQPACKRQNFD